MRKARARDVPPWFVTHESEQRRPPSATLYLDPPSNTSWARSEAAV